MKTLFEVFIMTIIVCPIVLGILLLLYYLFKLGWKTYLKKNDKYLHDLYNDVNKK